MTRNLLMTAAGTVALLAASPAFAQSADVQIDVVLNVADACTVTGGGGGPLGGQALLDFGQTSIPSTTTIDSSTSSAQGGIPITITCNSATVLSGVQVQIGGGNNDASLVRRMQNVGASGTSGEFVPYRLYATAARSSVLEYVPNFKLALQGSPVPNVSFEIVAYGRILGPDLSNIVSGGYSDQTTMTVTY